MNIHDILVLRFGELAASFAELVEPAASLRQACGLLKN